MYGICFFAIIAYSFHNVKYLFTPLKNKGEYFSTHLNFTTTIVVCQLPLHKPANDLWVACVRTSVVTPIHVQTIFFVHAIYAVPTETPRVFN